MEIKQTEAAFKWVIKILKHHSIPFQIGGGFAAHMYGSKRELADIDIALPESRFTELLPEFKDHITFGPAKYVDENWDLTLMTIVYLGQEVDIAGALEKKYFNKKSQKWVAFPTDFTDSYIMEVYGLQVPLMPKERLISYKTMLGREVDLLDIKDMS